MVWPTIELGSSTEIRGGATPRRDNPVYWNGDIPWVTPTDLPPLGEGIVDVKSTADAITEEGLDSCSVSLLPPGTVLFSSRASIGKIGIAAVSLTTNQGFANLIPGPDLESRYLAWCLHFHADRISGLAGLDYVQGSLQERTEVLSHSTAITVRATAHRRDPRPSRPPPPPPNEGRG